MKRKDVLDRAAECVLKDRMNAYGKPEDHFREVADLWSVYLGLGEVNMAIKPHDVACMMLLMKIARSKTSPHHLDHWIDMAGYAACGGEVAPDAPKPDPPSKES